MSETRILYAVQATGNGHLARAQEVLPHLQQYGDVDVLVSGTQSELKLPIAPSYRLDGLSFTFGKEGGIDFRDTFTKTILPQFKLRVIKELLSIPIQEYDWVLHDFEPITAWRAKLAGVRSAQLSHQAAFLSPQTPRAIPGSPLTELIFRCAAPSNFHIGLHYQAYSDTISTPIIRRAVRELEPENRGHYVVYLPSYGDEYLVRLLKQFPSIEWHVFNKHHQETYIDKNVTVRPISEKEFLPLFASAEGIVTGAGFQATSEAIFLGKKLLSVPQKSQFEQKSNARALSLMGVPTIATLDQSTIGILDDWIEYSKPITIRFPLHTEELIKKIVAAMDVGHHHMHKSPPLSRRAA